MKTLLFALALMCSVTPQHGDWEASIPVLCNVSSLEELSEEDLEHFRHLNSNPLDINHCRSQKLKSSRLLSNYQAASLVDYVRSTGEIRSLTELSLVDGFSQEFVSLISPFIEITAYDAPGERKNRYVKQEIRARTDFKGYAGKYSLDSGNTASVHLGLKSGDAPTFGIDASFGNWAACLGDFNFRFGQGLTAWSGMTMSGASAANLERNPSGTSIGTGYSRGSRPRGAALNYDKGGLSATICYGTGDMAVANCTYLWNSGQAGATSLYCGDNLVTGMDFKQKAGHADLFGETALLLPGKIPALLVGAQWQPEYLKKRSIVLRYYPAAYNNPYSGAIRTYSKCSDELGLSAATSSKTLTGTVDACYRPQRQTKSLKSIIDYKPNIKTNKLTIIPQLRATIRYRPEDIFQFHTDLRGDLSLSTEHLSADARIQATICKSSGLLGYIQAGYKNAGLSAEARYTIYNIKHWEDRIYVWQRGLPGTFNVPAFYGKGMGFSLWCAYKKALYLRASYDICSRDELKSNWVFQLEYVKHFFHSYSAGTFHKNDSTSKRIFRKE